MIEDNALLSEYLRTVELSDCSDGIKKLPGNSADLMLADPPCGLSKCWKWNNNIRLHVMNDGCAEQDADKTDSIQAGIITKV